MDWRSRAINMIDAGDATGAGALEFVERAAREREAQYRQKAAEFRAMAEVEPLASLRRHLRALARQYEELAAGAEVQAKTERQPSR
jgi:hypothetical protein